ncbi:MAG: hypothetical protein P1U61_05330 [Legionellaceae bacterium]|nr:hypothetical protein [Legionellaceae bacterium]
MWTFERTINVLTALGVMPILMCFFIKHFPTLPIQLMILVYIAIVLSFIAGIDWLIGVRLKSLPVVLWAVVSSLMPFFLDVIHLLRPNIFSSFVILLLLLIQLWIMLLADTKIYTWADMHSALSFRRIGTAYLSICIVINLYTLI